MTNLQQCLVFMAAHPQGVRERDGWENGPLESRATASAIFGELRRLGYIHQTATGAATGRWWLTPAGKEAAREALPAPAGQPTRRLRVIVADEDGTVRDSREIELSVVARRLKVDARAIMDASDLSEEMIRDGFALN